jgi:hypothetical protein
MTSIFQKTAMVILMGFFLCGCTSSKNISKISPFSEYVGRTVSLNRPMLLLPEGRGMWEPAHFPRLRSSPFVLLDYEAARHAGFYSAGRHDTQTQALAAGHAVIIDQVRDEIAFDAANIIAYGRVRPSGFTNDVRFAYAWGQDWILRPAPWEPESVPQIRRPPGKVPPHWDYEMFRAPSNAPTWGNRNALP